MGLFSRKNKDKKENANSSDITARVDSSRESKNYNIHYTTKGLEIDFI